MLTVDSQVFKIKDPRVTALSQARLAVQQFVYTIRPGDWFILFGHTIYALTQDEYYAAQQMNFVNVLTKQQFQQALQRTDYKEKDRKQIQFIRTHKSKCSKCQYNAYKNRVLKILQGYPNIITQLRLEQEFYKVPDYPETTEAVKAKVSYVFPKFFQTQTYIRKPCLDCVEKHMSQVFEYMGKAWVKGNEGQQGYPEHVPLAVINMIEAFQECPSDCPELKDFIMFCIGKTKHQNKVFMPIRNLMYLIELSRDKTKTEEALDQNVPDVSFDLDLTQDMVNNLSSLPVTIKAALLAQIKNLLRVEYMQPSVEQKASFQGILANMADTLVPFCPQVSNVLRNRRLLFRATPQLTANTELDGSDVKRALQAVKVQENVVSSEGTADSAATKA